jgi:hypothetical protein
MDIRKYFDYFQTFAIDVYSWSKIPLLERRLYNLCLQSKLLAFGYTVMDTVQHRCVNNAALEQAIERDVIRRKASDQRAQQLYALLKSHRTDVSRIIYTTPTTVGGLHEELLTKNRDFDVRLSKQPTKATTKRVATIYVRVLMHPKAGRTFEQLVSCKCVPYKYELRDMILDNIPCTLFVPRLIVDKGVYETLDNTNTEVLVSVNDLIMYSAMNSVPHKMKRRTMPNNGLARIDTKTLRTALADAAKPWTR